MTRWVAQTHLNYVSVTPYNWTASTIHGFQGTRQPAIWMGESGPVVVVPGVTETDHANIKSTFEERGLKIVQDSEKITPAYYSVLLDDGHGGEILVEQSATSRVGHLRFTFTSPNSKPYILLESSRPSILTSTPTNISYPHGTVSLHFGAEFSSVHEVCGSNSERQDSIITPISTLSHVSNFAGYYCARFSLSSASSHGTIQNSTIHPLSTSGEGPLLSAYVHFPPQSVVDVRIGTSFISTEQARANIDAEIPDGMTLEETVRVTKTKWIEKLDMFELEGASEEQKEIFFTGVAHALQYPYEQHEQGRYYSGYDGRIHEGESYTGYSIWDTYRAEWAFLILFAPERLPGMITSMLADYTQGGWLPMWKNIVDVSQLETNIMVGTHADSLIAEAVVKGVTGFDLELAWEAVWKDATVPPENDLTTSYFDREENVDYEVRAGLSSTYAQQGWVADDIHSESASRTLDYAYDDYAAYKLASALGKPSNVTDFLLERSLRAPFTLFNSDTGFMEARNSDGTWAGEDRGWTEAGAAYKTQLRVREIAQMNYNNKPTGLSGNEDCGQMSAWYIFSAMGFYPVNPVSGEYIVGSPFFDKVTVRLPPRPEHKADQSRTLTIIATGAPTKPYIRSLTVNGRRVDVPIIKHEDLIDGGEIVFEMSERVEEWGNVGFLEQYASMGGEGTQEEIITDPRWAVEHVEL
ncbi:hypothetical protein C0992_008697 [Termitomyces sp. T32_za158]|nr:hypothetical protein C0992_008697 [Termitomyces sp. T32_za158]